MKTRPVLLIAGVTAALFVGALLLAILLGRTLQSARAQANSETARAQFVARWRPPTLRPGISPLPPQVRGRLATNQTTQVRLPDLGLDLPGWSASYGTPGADTIDVLALPPGTTDPAPLFARVQQDYDASPGNQALLRASDRVRLSRVSPQRVLDIWTLHGWIFVFSAPTDPGTDFIRACLEGVSAPTGAAPAPVPLP
ncbi:MAG: hypothetical protein IT580_16245 [Verrucomicrobiales bacterium]|nr:hypothetical protein [Verrucomicrobiales bacterium]